MPAPLYMPVFWSSYWQRADQRSTQQKNIIGRPDRSADCSSCRFELLSPCRTNGQPADLIVRAGDFGGATGSCAISRTSCRSGELDLLPALATTTALLTSGYIEHGNDATNQQRMIALCVVAALVAIFGALSAKTSANSGKNKPGAPTPETA